MPTETHAAILLRVFSEELDNPELSAEDDFYAMGGDSLVALRVVSRAQELGLAVTLRDLLYHPSAAALGEFVASTSPAPGRAGAAPEAAPFSLLSPADRALVPPGAEDALPASALQVGILYLCAATADPALYHDLINLEVRAPFDGHHLRGALAELTQRHPALRSSFDLGAYSVPVQLVWTSVEPSLTVEEAADAAAAVEAERQWCAGQLATGLSWRRAPLLRCHVVTAPEGFRLTLAIHHAVIDGWSYARLVVDLLTLYDRRITADTTPLPAVSVAPYREFLRLEQAAAQDPTIAAFWREQASATPLLDGRRRFDTVPNPTAMREIPIGDDELARLRANARRADTPLKSLFLAIHFAALANWTQRRTGLVSGVVVNGRPEVPGADLVVGLFLNTLPMCLDVPVGSAWEDLARSALDWERAALPNRRFPLANLERELGGPAFDVVFNFTHFHAYDELDGLSAVQVASWSAFDKNSFPIMVDFSVDAPESGTGVVITVDPTLVPDARAQELYRCYREALLLAVDGLEPTQ